MNNGVYMETLFSDGAAGAFVTSNVSDHTITTNKLTFNKTLNHSKRTPLNTYFTLVNIWIGTFEHVSVISAGFVEYDINCSILRTQ